MLNKTLSQLGFKNAKSENAADYSTCRPYVCCGWMELHSDIGSGASFVDPFFYIKPIYWSRFAYLVVTGKDGKFHVCSKFDYLNRKKIDGIYYNKDSLGFDATKLHGLVSKNVARILNGKKSTDDSLGDVYEKFSDRCGDVWDGSNFVKMIWEWDENENPT